MLPLVLGRLLTGGLAVVFLVVLVQALMALAPGDPLAAVLGPTVRSLPAEEQARLRAEAGLDRPWAERALVSLGVALRGDLGRSWRSGRAVTDELRDRLAATAMLALAALPLSLALGLTIGVAAAALARSWADTVLSALVMVGSAVPVYWTALLLLSLFALTLGWLPASGGGGWKHLLLPALTLGVASAAPLARVTRAALLDALGEPHVPVAQAKGASRARVLVRHGLRNALVPIVTLAGIDLGRMLSGTVFVESVFAWPGLGRLLVDAIAARDVPLVQGVVIVAAAVVVLLSLLVDLLYVRLDPRVRYR